MTGQAMKKESSARNFTLIIHRLGHDDPEAVVRVILANIVALAVH